MNCSSLSTLPFPRVHSVCSPGPAEAPRWGFPGAPRRQENALPTPLTTTTTRIEPNLAPCPGAGCSPAPVMAEHPVLSDPLEGQPGHKRTWRPRCLAVPFGRVTVVFFHVPISFLLLLFPIFLPSPQTNLSEFYDETIGR